MLCESIKRKIYNSASAVKMLTLEEYIELLEQLVLEKVAELKEHDLIGGMHPHEIDKKFYCMWEPDCDGCIDLLEGQCPQELMRIFGMKINPKKLLIGNLQSRKARIVQLQDLKRSQTFLKRRYECSGSIDKHSG